jgi:hypothetical protein
MERGIFDDKVLASAVCVTEGAIVDSVKGLLFLVTSSWLVVSIDDNDL